MAWEVLTHGDCDGLCAGAISHMVTKGDIWFSRPSDLAHSLSKIPTGTSVIITDLALNERDKEKILAELERLSSASEVYYFDHHPLPVKKELLPVTDLRHDLLKSASELVYRYYRDSLPREAVKVALYGAIGDYCDTTIFVLNELQKWDKRIIYFQSGVLSQGLGEARHEYEFKRELVKELASEVEPSQNQVLVRKALKESLDDLELYDFVKENTRIEGELAYVVVKNGSLGKGAHFALGMNKARVGLCGRVFDDDVDMSLRCRKKEKIKLNEIVQRVSARFNGNGGGHASAAGAHVPLKEFDAFVKELAEEIKSGK